MNVGGGEVLGAGDRAQPTVSTVAIKWLQLLEKEFDKVYIDLDSLFGELEDEHNLACYSGREKLTAMSAAFGQLAHKALTVFELNNKLQAQLDEAKSQLFCSESGLVVAEKEMRGLMTRLQAAQLEVSKQKNISGVEDTQVIQQKLENEMRTILDEVERDARMKSELDFLRKENEVFRKSMANTESELVGAKLAAKYLDKELAGRIQQIQLLNGNLKPAEQDRLWCQLQSEIRLHRHKTVIRACRARLDREAIEDERTRTRHVPPSGEVRRVVVYKAHNEGLGISITGGKEHGVPILVSEVHQHMPAWRSGQVFVGDAILSVNDTDIRNAFHDEAVAILSKQEGSVELDLLYIEEEEEDEKEKEAEKEENRLKYHLFLPGDIPMIGNGSPGEQTDEEERNGSITSETKTSSPKTDASVKGSDSSSLE